MMFECHLSKAQQRRLASGQSIRIAAASLNKGNVQLELSDSGLKKIHRAIKKHTGVQLNPNIDLVSGSGFLSKAVSGVSKAANIAKSVVDEKTASRIVNAVAPNNELAKAAVSVGYADNKNDALKRAVDHGVQYAFTPTPKAIEGGALRKGRPIPVYSKGGSFLGSLKSIGSTIAKTLAPVVESKPVQQLISQPVNAAVTGYTGNPVAGQVAGQLAATGASSAANAAAGAGIRRGARMVKGSEEAMQWAARMREARMQKGGSFKPLVTLGGVV